MPDAILVVMMLAVGDVFCVAHCHLFTTVPKTMVKKEGKRQNSVKILFTTQACDDCKNLGNDIINHLHVSNINFPLWNTKGEI